MKRSGLIYSFLKKSEHPGTFWFWRLMNTLFVMGMIHYGKFVYNKVRRKYQDCMIVLSPTTDLGDQLFLRMFLNEFININEITKCVFVFDQRNQRCIDTMDFGNSCYLDAKQLSALTMYYHSKADGLLTIMDCYPWVLYDFAQSSLFKTFRFPQFYVDGQKVKDKLEEKKLLSGRTVVLSPYEQNITAMGLPVLSKSFWERLAGRLIQLGFSVCTNCKGTSEQPVVKGTHLVFPLPLEMQEFIEQAGFFIGIRSGLVDFISQAKANVIVLYPNEIYYNKWSLKKMKLNDTTEEIIYESMDLDLLLEQLVARFEES